MTIEQFGQTIQTKYPTYAGKDPAQVGQAMLAKYPQYQSQIDKAPQSWGQKLGLVNPTTGKNLLQDTFSGLAGPVVNSAKAMVEPVVKGLATGVRSIQATPQVFQQFGNTDWHNLGTPQDFAQEIKNPTTPAGQTMSQPVFGQKTLTGSTALQNTGTALNAASNLMGVKGELPSILNSQVGRAGVQGFVQGATQGGGQYLTNTDNPTFGGFAGAAGQGGFTGAVMGAGAAKASPLFTSDTSNPASLAYKASHPSSLVPDVLTKDVPTLRAQAVTQGLQEMNTRTKSLGSSFKDNTKTYTTTDGTKTTVTPADTFAKYQIKPEVTKGTIDMGDYQQGTGALGQIKEQVTNLDNQIDTTLKNTGQQLDITELKNEAIAAAKTNPELRRAGTVQSTITKLNARFDDYQSSYGDKIDIAELNNIRKVANKDYNVETQDASRIVGDVARDKVYNATDDQQVKSLLQQQGDLLSARKYAEKLNGSKVQGGRLGTYFMRTTGAILGSAVDKTPLVGPLVGALGGEALSRGLQASQFTSPMAEFKAGVQKVGSLPVGLSIQDVSPKAQALGEAINNMNKSYVEKPTAAKKANLQSLTREYKIETQRLSNRK